jgi:hypothetical protein
VHIEPALFTATIMRGKSHGGTEYKQKFKGELYEKEDFLAY